MQPLHDRVLVLADEPDKKTKSGIYVHREWKQLAHTGLVKNVGAEVTEVNKGDRVHFNRYAFTPLGEGLFIGSVKNINAVIT